jgi:hypothetical protein
MESYHTKMSDLFPQLGEASDVKSFEGFTQLGNALEQKIHVEQAVFLDPAAG